MHALAHHFEPPSHHSTKGFRKLGAFVVLWFFPWRMNHEIECALESWLAAGRNCIGEVTIRRHFELLHRADAERENGLQMFNTPQAAREIARFDEAGNFRPLKSAPTLRRGWKLVLRDICELHEALDFFYPAMLGTLLAHKRGELEIVPLRETLNRQSGMYAVTRKITNAQADELIGRFCRSDGKCLKTILWPIEPGAPVTALPASKFDPAVDQLGADEPAIPLLCSEACNLLVAAARGVVRKPESPK
jgi:sirohydrochlorin cobaltochelatase